MTTFRCRIILLDDTIIERDLEVSSQSQYSPPNISINLQKSPIMREFIFVFIEKSSGPGSV